MSINLLLIPEKGAIGAALGTLFAEISVCVMQCFSVRKELPINKFILFSMPFIIAGTAMVAFLLNISIMFQSQVVDILAKVLLGAIVYITVAMVLMVPFRNYYKEVALFLQKNK